MKYAVLLATTALVGSAAAAAMPLSARQANPVCIVGAGPAGLRAAHALEARGRTVVLFDKHAEAGGKSQTYYDPDDRRIFSPLGGLLLENHTYVETRQVIAQTNLPYLPAPFIAPSWSFDYASGAVSSYPTLSADEAALLAQEIERYSGIWTQKFEPIGGVGYRDPIPAEFTLTTAEWLAANDFQVLPVLFNLAMFPYGYGDLRETPILYMLQYFTPTIVGGFAGSPVDALSAIDFHSVFVQYAAKIKGTRHMSTTVTSINRSGAAPVVTYQQGYQGAPRTQACSELILAFPPTLASLEAAGLDLAAEERALFAAVRTTNYFSGSVSTEIPDQQLWYENSSSPALPPPARGEPVAFIKLFPGADLTTTWSWSTTDTSEAEARNMLIETLSRINKADPTGPETQSVSVTNKQVHAFQQNIYFPRVSGQDLADDFYIKLDKLQGQRKTFYASGLNGFELVEFALRAGKDIVEHYIE